ncbi:hypothetical protein J6590_047671 [Homalodisca vitripennis]|nr:hypothetical protein J6590_047671 [Homalodisca vitripennis]
MDEFRLTFPLFAALNSKPDVQAVSNGSRLVACVGVDVKHSATPHKSVNVETTHATPPPPSVASSAP